MAVLKCPIGNFQLYLLVQKSIFLLTVTIDEENPLQQSNEKPHHIKITFLDSCAFLPSSLAKLADTLHPDDLVNCHGLGHRKGVFPIHFLPQLID